MARLGADVRTEWGWVEMSVTVIIRSHVDPGERDAIIGEWEQALPATRAFDGCQRLDLFVDEDDPGAIVLIQEWESRAHEERYLAWRAETGMPQAATRTTGPSPFTILALRRRF